MSTSKHIDKICILVVVFMLVLTILFMNGETIGLIQADRVMGYETRLFDTSRVHTLDIVMDDWNTFIEGCESEEYSPCALVIDGESFKNVGLRAKGNTSLRNVSQSGSSRYSFKIEFDQYENGKSYHGLDKLCLNNLIQDNTMMKDYIVYQMMTQFGADSPLCSFVYITVNGEDWGLYLAVEGVEDSFLQRNYGKDGGELYKPDSMSFGAGRGNGKDFDFDAFQNEGTESESKTQPKEQQTQSDAKSSATLSQPSVGNMSFSGTPPEMPNGDFSGTPPEMPNGDFSGTPPEMPNGGFSGTPPEMPNGDFSGTPPEMPNGDFSGTPPEQQTEQQETLSAEPATEPAESNASTEQKPSGESADSPSSRQGMGGGMGGMGSDDVKLKYIDDDPDSYSNIFSSAKTDITDEDEARLIASLKDLSNYENLENVLDTEEVLRYFVVHNFVCNGDSYTGSMIHNYYLHEKDGKLGMIPWDYNLAFGTFQGGNASSSVEASIDSPVSGGDTDDRPMVGWIFANESSVEQYHALFEEFLDRYFTDGELVEMIETTKALIAPYVEKDPTKFCTTEEFEKGVETMQSFVTLRAQSVRNQLSGSTQTVDTNGLNLSDMGTMGGGMGGNQGDKGEQQMPEMPQGGMFDFSSMLTVTDKDGNEVDASTILPDLSEIACVTFSDGSQVELSGKNAMSLMQKDFSEIVSVTDTSGNVTDLTGYTISVQMPDFPFGNGKNEKTDGDSNRPSMGKDFPSSSTDAPQGAQSQSTSTWLWLGISVLVLAAGIIFAGFKKY